MLQSRQSTAVLTILGGQNILATLYRQPPLIFWKVFKVNYILSILIKSQLDVILLMKVIIWVLFWRGQINWMNCRVLSS